MLAAEIQPIADGIWPKDNNPLVTAPHTADDIMDNDWTRPYSRKQAGTLVAITKKTNIGHR